MRGGGVEGFSGVPKRIRGKPALDHIKNMVSKVPWWGAIAIRDATLIKHYSDKDGIAEGLPDTIVRSYVYQKRCSVPESDVVRRYTDRNACIVISETFINTKAEFHALMRFPSLMG